MAQLKIRTSLAVFGVAMLHVVMCNGKGASTNERTALDVPFALRFNASKLNVFGDFGEWLVEREYVSGHVPEQLKAVPQATQLRKPLHDKIACSPDDEGFYEKAAQKYVTNAFRNSSFAARWMEARCGVKAQCGRSVIDNYFEEEDLKELERLGVQRWGGLTELREMVEERFGMVKGRLTAVGGQIDSNVQSDVPCQMHVDFQSRPGHYYYTAIIYLSNQKTLERTSSKKSRKGGHASAKQSPPRCESCETVFVDEVNQSSGLALRGLVVQPRRGRTVIFSGGAENLHCKVPSSGDRRVVQVFFQCNSDREL
eukprot:TRINITY_DN49677_c0_g1_i1.p1 TRINITY_DN49677_c0_g1~~TRINITY_DN49677_c0_g1_i1.p1  ORF type:complete len:339 (-),score=48.45 TRINITY_DN49677_c0_g1_i1:237-1172(-)